ncbi:MAG: diguanylate cyclase (GGDEF)-like protein, partial [Myxococcota bacterium]
MSKRPDIPLDLAQKLTLSGGVRAGRAAAQVPQPTQRVLLVEASLRDAQKVSGFLRTGGLSAVTIDHVQTLAAALNRLGHTDYDIAFVDLSLADAGGPDAVSRLQLVAPNLPIIVLSSEDNEAQGLQSVQLGAQDYLPKGDIDGPLLTRSMRYARERKRVEQRLAKLAHYDQLTGVANRAMFRERLELTLTKAAHQKERFSVLFLDLDRFKAINDSLGHLAGDAVLVEVARRLTLCVRDRDMVARLGGDEFAILLEGVSQDAQITEVALRILALLGEPIIVDQVEIPLTASIGASVYPFSAGSMEGMIRAADAAMYRAKGRGRSNFELCTGDALVPLFGRLRMETALRRALERDEFSLDYQPQVALTTGEIVGAEA